MEFAFVLPLLLVLILGVYTVGAVMHSISSVRYALEETARTLQMNPKLTQSDLQKAIDGKLVNYGKQAVTLTMTVQKNDSGSDVARLTASYPYMIAVPFIPKYEGAYQQTVDIFLVIAP
ncbi:TadE/TadG family type IV pilus assembly protein [Taklimakanibacter deserti]|uniref:TadE/TadG family type IV pilus assembly protein n=1 Tax=Taklimakanibacter deserti TaxID=2267839 RepID=UPI0013C4AB3C